MWYRCDIHLSEVAAARLFPNGGHGGRVFRRLVALMADEDALGLPPAVLNYGDGDPMQKLPPVRFASFARGVSILGVGAEGAELAQAIAPVIHAALTRRARALLPVYERGGETSFSPRPFHAPYFTAGAVLSPTKGVHKWLGWMDSAREHQCSLADIPEAREAIEGRIAAALMRQVDALDPAELENGRRTCWNLLASEDDELAMVRRGDKPFNVRVLTTGKPFVETRMNNTARALRAAGGPGPMGNLPLVGLRHIEFTVDAELKGIWQVGRLTSSGYGLVHAANRVSELAEGVA